MKSLFKLLAPNAVWVLTTVWAALMILKATAVAHGGLSVATELLVGPNFLSAAVSAAALLLFVGLATLAAGSTMFLIFAVQLRPARIWWFAGAAGFVFAALLLLATTGVILLVAVGLEVLIGAVYACVLGLVRKRAQARPKPPSRPAINRSSARSYSIALLAWSGASLVVGVVLSGPWLQTEDVHLKSGTHFTGYYLDQDARWTTFLIDSSRDTVIIETADIRSRENCSKAPKINIDRRLTYTLGAAPVRLPPVCRP